MSADVIISVEKLGKMYRLRTGGQTGERYTALRDVLTDKAKSLFRRNGGKSLTSDLGPPTSEVSPASREDFWALKDVSFEVHQGEVVGIIGRNGAGKSTLLKILSRITDPTEGRVRIKGRVASLLEVGTGFHPELTGRENIFLNGAILGMRRAEIAAKFDEIVAFAETEKFLDTPVKRYSSGMYVRLAFAVAAHLEPEILVVDEVLAVGDAEFQKKCLGKMESVARREGRTILFVSHNLPAVQSLCTKGLLLRSGQVEYLGNVEEAIFCYRKSALGINLAQSPRMTVSGSAELCTDEAGDSAARISLTVVLRGPLAKPSVGFGLDSSDGVRIATIFTETSVELPSLSSGCSCRFRIATEPFRVSPGHIGVKSVLADNDVDIETLEGDLVILVPEYDRPTRRSGQKVRGVIQLRSSVTYDT